MVGETRSDTSGANCCTAGTCTDLYSADRANRSRLTSIGWLSPLSRALIGPSTGRQNARSLGPALESRMSKL
jgi:hypothetical protein